jgi:RNA recognition motif-containing protein
MRQDKIRGNVFVANLPPGYTEEQLAAAFDDFGLVLSAFLARDPETGALKNFGLVNIAPEQAAAEAIAALNGNKIGGRKIEVRKADPNMALSIPKPKRRPPAAPAPTAPSAPAASDTPPAPARSFVVERLPARRKF